MSAPELPDALGQGLYADAAHRTHEEPVSGCYECDLAAARLVGAVMGHAETTDAVERIFDRHVKAYLRVRRTGRSPVAEAHFSAMIRADIQILRALGEDA